MTRISAWYLAWTIPELLLPGFFLFLPSAGYCNMGIRSRLLQPRLKSS